MSIASRPRLPLLSCFLLVLLPPLIAACGDGGLGVSDVAEVAVQAGADQQGVVGEPVAPIEVLVTTADGTPVGGVPVGWTIGSGSGALAQAETTTDGEGRSSNTWTLGTAAGDQTVQATVGAVAPAIFTATAVPGPPASVQLSPGTLGLQSLGETAVLTARARDAFDNEISDAAFQWSSSNEAVASVDDAGRVEAAGNGSATVTATTGDVSGTASVTVEQLAVTVNVTPSSLLLEALEATAQLSADALDANGSPLAEATVDWTSSDDGVVTVTAQGQVESMANGTATITARVQNGSGSGSVTVEQAPVSVTVTPDSVQVDVGAEAALTAEARDANDFPVEGQTFEWSSSDETVATVDASGTVRGESVGQATVTATAGDAMATAHVEVSPPIFEPTADTVIGGSMNLASLSVPADVTVTVEGDTELIIQGAATVAGTLTGGCVDLTLTAGGPLTVRGTVATGCPPSPARATAPRLELRAAGDLLFEDAVIEPAYALFIGAPEASGLSALRGASSQSVQETCTFRRSTLGAVEAQDGFDEDAPLEIECQEDMVFEASTVVGRNGAPGVDVVGQTSAVASHGFKSGDIRITSMGAGGMTFRATAGGPTRILGGEGGKGGDARATGPSPVISSQTVRARGGNGGDAGEIMLRGSRPAGVGELGPIVVEAGSLVIGTGSGGDGGLAEATGGDGLDREDGDDNEGLPPGPGGTAIITPGDGGTFRNNAFIVTKIEHDKPLILGEISDASLGNITLLAGSPGDGGPGRLYPGNGGHDLRTSQPAGQEVPGGGAGGNAIIEAVDGQGGNGGDAKLVDNRPGVADPQITSTGMGSIVIVSGGRGGNGLNDCRVGSFSPGGNGGRGGDLRRMDGTMRGGETPEFISLGNGEIFSDGTGNGGNGGDGINDAGLNGVGGAGGEVQGIRNPEGVEVFRLTIRERSFEIGGFGGMCQEEHEVDVSVQSDPSGHEQFVGMTGVMALGHEIGLQEMGGQMVPFLSLSGAGPWVPLTGQLDENGSFSLSGAGTVAGFQNIRVTMSGSLAVEQEGQADPSDVGRIMGFSGTLVVGSEGGLPGGQPATYGVSANRKEDEEQN